MQKFTAVHLISHTLILSYVANAENAINIMVENMFLLWPKYACYREMTLSLCVTMVVGTYMYISRLD